MSTKVVVVGGGSTYTPELVDGLCDHEDRLRVDELVLFDPDTTRLDAVGGLSRRILETRGWRGRVVATTSREEALDGAVLRGSCNCVSAVRRRASSDETIPPTFGCVGQETTGAGGLAKALRTVPVVLELAEEAAARAAPGAWIVDFTNPVGIVTQALLDEGHKAVGFCNVARLVQRRIGHYLAVAPDDVVIEHAGLNHLTWVRGATIGGVDRLGELLERFGPEMALESGAPLALVRVLGALPSYYLHYYYCRDEELAAQKAPGYRPRAAVVADLEAELLEEYRDPRLATKPRKLSYRGGAYYSEAAVRLMASLQAGTGDVHVVDVRNTGALPGLPGGAVVELPCVVDRDGAHPVQQRSLAPEMMGLVEHLKAYEELAVAAAVHGSRDLVVRALVANPLVGQWPVAEELADALLDANRHLLPRFTGSA